MHSINRYINGWLFNSNTAEELYFDFTFFKFQYKMPKHTINMAESISSFNTNWNFSVMVSIPFVSFFIIVCCCILKQILDIMTFLLPFLLNVSNNILNRNKWRPFIHNHMTVSHLKFKKASYYYLMSSLFSNPPIIKEVFRQLEYPNQDLNKAVLTAFDCSVSQILSDRAGSSCL